MVGVMSLLSTTPDGSYRAGSVIDISVLFNGAVTVTGSPQLALALPSGQLATYSGLTDADTTMHFSYIVQAGDTSTDLDAISTSALTLHGGTIVAAADLSAAVLTLPTPGTSGSLGANTSLVIDTTAPTETSVLVPANATYVQGQNLDFAVSLSEAVTVNTTGGTPYISVALDTGGTVHATYLSGSGTSTLTFRYTVAAGNADNNGITVGALSLAGATVTDQAGNPMILTLNAVGSTAGVLVNGLNPVFNSAAVNGDNLVVNYSEATTLDAAHPPGSNAYSVQVDGVADGVTGMVINSAAKTVTLTLATAVTAGQTVTLAYTDPTAGNDINALQNAAGNDASSFSATEITNNTHPAIVAVSVPANATYLQGQNLDFTVSVSEAVTVNTTGGTPYISVVLDTGGTVHATYLSGSGTSALIFRYTVTAGDSDNNGITVGALSLAGATVTDQTGAPMTLTLNAVGNTTAVLVNGLNPVFTNAAVNGDNLVVSYSEATTLDAAHIPAPNAYSVQVGGVADAVTGIVIDSAAKTATLTLATAVTAGQTVTLAYTDPTAGNDINALQNAAGNDASSFSATVITNNTVAAPNTGSGVTVSAPADGGVLHGTPYADTFIGSGNKDIFYPAGGTDTVDGGAGVDTVVLTGNRSQYTLTHQSDGSFTVRSLVDGNSVVTLNNVERLTFDNQTLALDVTPASSRVAELYQLTLGRNPEEAGLGYHVAMNTQGANTTQLALDFVNSNEFSRLYSTLNSENLVTQFYLNAFGRAPDADGLAFHLAQLAKNPGSVGLANVVAVFVDSPEMAVKLAGMVDQGIPLYG